jgi:hypothetical protein
MTGSIYNRAILYLTRLNLTFYGTIGQEHTGKTSAATKLIPKTDKHQTTAPKLPRWRNGQGK